MAEWIPVYILLAPVEVLPTLKKSARKLALILDSNLFFSLSCEARINPFSNSATHSDSIYFNEALQSCCPLVSIVKLEFQSQHSSCVCIVKWAEGKPSIWATEVRRNRFPMNTKMREVFDVLDYLVVKIIFFALALIGAAALIAHAIKVSF